MRGLSGCLLALVIGLGATVAARAADPGTGSSAGDASSQIAPAERLLFMTTHLHGIAPQTELDYAMNAAGPSEKVADTVRVLIVSPDNTSGDARVTDRSGRVEVPGGLPCNPVILYFLEHDIAEMEQQTGGKRRYFQQRVRLALAAGPPVTQVTTDANGKPVKARKIVIQPYLGDPNAQRFAKYVEKRYTFLITDDVPGSVILIRTEVPGDHGDFAHPLQVETLSYQGALRNLPPADGTTAPPKPPNAPRASR